MKTAIVLSGGGARGAYQIGVWKALKKLHIKYDIVTGTSVGALNGALMVQKTYRKAYQLWKRMDFSTLFQENDIKMLKQEGSTKNLMRMYTKNMLNGGMNVEKLEQITKKYLNQKKFSRSPIDFGLITVNSKTKKPKIITKDKFEIEKLYDYLIASASCYPVFQKKKIEEEEYIDGGFYDNLPINLAIDLGAEDIIAIDLKAVGLVKKVKNKEIPITYITPNNEIGSFLVFNKENAKKAMKFGYNDTMKKWHRLEGNKFTFYKNQLTKNNKKIKENIETFLNDYFKVEKESTVLEEIVKNTTFRRIIHKKELEEKNLNETIEYIGTSFHLEESNIYTIRKFKRNIKKELKKTNAVTKQSLLEQKIPTTKEIIKFFYEKITMQKIPKKKDLTNLALLFPKEFLSAVYLKEWLSYGK